MTDIKIILIGFKGCGKSTIGKIVAEDLGLFFTDTDNLIEKRYNTANKEDLSFRDIYKRVADGKFREMELNAAKSTLDDPLSGVIAFGGGTLENLMENNIEVKDAIVVLIEVKKEIIYDRIMRDGTPAFLDQEDPRSSFETFYKNREGQYKEVAEFCIDNSNSIPHQAADKIVRYVRENRAKHGW